jgi:predicted nucleic acid-binding protein
MHEAVSNSSTLIHLSAIGYLKLLKKFHGKIIIPPAVWKEVVEQGRSRQGVKEIQKARKDGWLKIMIPENKPLLQLLSSQLDDGEAEAIALAIEQKAAIIFLDESDARKIAEIYGIPKTGVIGILIRAKLQKKISSLKKELDKLQSESNFWIDKKLYNKVLESVGEKI